MNSDTKAFYGSAYERAKDTAKLDQAYERLMKAIANESNAGGPTKVSTGLLELAAKGEREAFA